MPLQTPCITFVRQGSRLPGVLRCPRGERCRKVELSARRWLSQRRPRPSGAGKGSRYTPSQVFNCFTGVHRASLGYRKGRAETAELETNTMPLPQLMPVRRQQIGEGDGSKCAATSRQQARQWHYQATGSSRIGCPALQEWLSERHKDCPSATSHSGVVMAAPAVCRARMPVR